MPLIYFIAGILFIYFIIPFFEGLLSFILTFVKRVEAQETAKIYKIQQTVDSESNSPKQAIGFVYKEEEEENDEEV